MTRSIQIVDFKEEYADAISNIVTRNLLEINSRDYGMEQVKRFIFCIEFSLK